VILPRWVRRSPKVAAVLPLLYLHGLSAGDFVPALREFFGSSAGLSASTVGRLAEQWQAAHAAFNRRDLGDRDYVYCWADGLHCALRLADGRLCALVIVGVRVDGTKELIAVAQGTRESTDDWAGLLRTCAAAGCARRPPAHLLRVSGRALAAPALDQSDLGVLISSPARATGA
jgi:putative transposase